MKQEKKGYWKMDIFNVRNKKILIFIGLIGLMILVDVWLWNKNNDRKETKICKNCNVILISLDTLAASHMPCYGYERNTMPNLCAFAKENIYFPNSYSNSHWTLPSHMSIFTSLYPTTHGVLQILKDNLNTKYETLPQLFKNNGYQTIYAGPGDDPYLPLELGLGKGFDNLIKVSTMESKNIDFWDKAIEMFKKNNTADKPTFMFLHTYAVHDPYLAGDKENYKFVKEDRKLVPQNLSDYYFYSPDKIQKMITYFEERIKSSDTPASLKRNNGILNAIKKYGLIGDYDTLDEYLTNEFSEEKYSIFRELFEKNIVFKKDFYRDLYDESIYNLDVKLKKIFDLVKDESLSKKTIIVITSDHGEAFWEHNEYGHSDGCFPCLFNETIKVPMIMYVPNINSNKNENLVQGIDIYPTLAEIIGIKPPEYIEGKNMLKQKNKYIISESNLEIPQKVIIDKKWKMSWNFSQEKKEIMLFDLTTDPGEKINVADKNADTVKDRISILTKFMDRPNVDKSNNDSNFPDWVDKSKREKMLKSGYF